MRLLLSIVAVMLVVQSANAQSLWRNFFTTNQNPIVEVVAGSNATVQASTVGVNLRRFTVNSIPGSSGFASNVFGTNVIGAVAEATHATNADFATYSTNSGYATNAGTAASGWPTNWPLASITNANHLTNWALVPTNYVPLEAQHATNADFAAYATNAGFATNSSNATNAEFVTTATLTNQIYASNVVSGGQIVVTALATNTPSASQVLTATSASSAAWQTPVNSGIDTNGVACSTLMLSPFDGSAFWFNSAHSTFVSDDFLTASYGTAVGTASGGASATSANPSGFENSGWYRLDSYPTNTGSYGTLRAWNIQSTWYSNFYVKASVVLSSHASADFTNSEYTVGMYQSQSAAITDGIYWLCRPDWTTNWIAAVSTTAGGTAYRTSSLPCTKSLRSVLEIKCPTTNSISFLTNGVIFPTPNIETNSPGGKIIGPIFRSKATASTGSAYPNYMYMDYIATLYK